MTSPIIGKFFHSFTRETIEAHAEGFPKTQKKVKWQGKILGRVTKKTYFAEIYDWITGQDRTLVLIPLSWMITQEFEFYDTSEEMIDAYERKYSR
jgi:hypothetical protein